MLQREHSAILLTFIKLPLVINIVVLSIFKWPFYTGFTVAKNYRDFLKLCHHFSIELFAGGAFGQTNKNSSQILSLFIGLFPEYPIKNSI